MGKLKRARQKYHLSRIQPDSSSVENENKIATNTDLVSTPPLPLMPLTTEAADRLFSGITISVDNLTKTLNEDDVKSVVSKKNEKLSSKTLTKKEKMKLRRTTFLKKLDTFYQARKETKMRKKRQKTVITGDLKPMADALPSLDFLLKEKAKKAECKKQTKKKKGVLKTKQRQKLMLQDISVFQRVLADPTYKADPAGAISNYIQEKARQGVIDET